MGQVSSLLPSHVCSCAGRACHPVHGQLISVLDKPGGFSVFMGYAQNPGIHKGNSAELAWTSSVNLHSLDTDHGRETVA